MDPDFGADPPKTLCCCCPPKRLVAGLEDPCPNAETPNGFLLAASVLGADPSPLKNPPELELEPPKIPELELGVVDPPKMEPLDAGGLLELKGDLKSYMFYFNTSRWTITCLLHTEMLCGLVLF